MISDSQDIFIDLLRSGLWNDTSIIPFEKQEVNWNKVWKIATNQSVWGLVTHAINHLLHDMQPDIKDLQRMNFMLSRNRQTHARLNSTLEEVVTLLNKNNITPVLLKGQGVAIYYHDSTLRCCGDIDLYIGDKNYDKACDIAKSWGEDEESTESEKHYHFIHNGITIELHHIAEKLPKASNNRRFQCWTNDRLTPKRCRRLKFGETEVLVPPSDFEVLYIFNHAFHHFLSCGIGLRQLCDWSLVLHKFHGSIDLHILEQNLNDFGLMRGWKVFGCIAVDELGLPQSEFPFYDASFRQKSRTVLRHIYNDGNFGFHNPNRTKRPDGYIAGKWHTFKTVHRRYASLFTIFPMEILFTWKEYISAGLKQVIKDKIRR